MVAMVKSRSVIADFVKSKEDWLQKHARQDTLQFYNGMPVGKGLTLRIVEDAHKMRSRLTHDSIIIFVVGSHDSANTEQHDYIERTVIRALRQQAENLVLPRLLAKSAELDIPFGQATVKRVHGRWGSCDRDKNIVMSMYLVQLPMHIVDYVIIHELAHTKHMNHGPAFWAEVAKHCPSHKLIRLQLKRYDPKIYDQSKML